MCALRCTRVVYFVMQCSAKKPHHTKEESDCSQSAQIRLISLRLICDSSEGELITLYPSDAILLWQDDQHSLDSKIQIFFGRHVAETDRDLARAIKEWRGYEVPMSARASVLADPCRRKDAAYLGAFANDGASCAGAGQVAYSLSRACSPLL